MKTIHPKEFRGKKAWDALDIATISPATIRLHWTDQPYEWHCNDGEEVFVVLDGSVDMHVRKHQEEKVIKLQKGDIFHAASGDEHYASPIGEARILVIEKAGSI